MPIGSGDVTSSLATLGASGWTQSNDPRFGGMANLWQSTWANRPLTGAIAVGQQLLVTDLGPSPGALCAWDGTRWRSFNPIILAQSAVPVVLLSSATNINATGLITGLTALPYTPSGVVQVYCFAQTGLAAGLYFARFSSTTSCQLYTDAAGTVTPTGITSAAYAGGTTAQVLANIAVPANAMGPNGVLRYDFSISFPNNANIKSIAVLLGGQTFASNTYSTAQQARLLGQIRNRGAGTQFYGGQTIATGLGSSGSPPVQLTVDTSAAQSAQLAGTLAVASDYLIIEGYTVEILQA